MGLYVGLISSGLLVSFLKDSFLIGFWLMGFAVLVSSGLVFSSLSVECLSEFILMSGLSASLIVMTLWVGGLCYLSSSVYKLKEVKTFSLCILVLSLLSVLFFSVSSWFTLYFFFEASLFPILMLILGWGYQPERLQAAGYMLMYTVGASLPLLVGLVMLFNESGSLSFFGVSDFGVGSFSVEWLLLPLLCLAFMVKFPIFMVHSWLPKAHVEAPVAGSMILAGVLLKFGGYGLLSVFSSFVPVYSMLMVNYLIGFGLWGGLLCSVMCLRQVDMKSLIAYSSIGHMALCFGGILSCFSMGWNGGLVLMVAHGLCSPGLFALANYCYSLFASRSLFVCCGVLGLVPSLSLSWFLFCSSNMAFPPSLSLMGEILLMVSLVSYSCWLVLPLGVMAFVAGVYSLLLYSMVQHGEVNGLMTSGSVIGSSVSTMTFLFWVPLNLLIVGGDFMFSWF